MKFDVPAFSETGIGSLPFTNSKTAVDFVLRTCPNIPYWPQLPKISLKESMIDQFSEMMPGIKDKNESLYVDMETSDLGRQVEQVYMDFEEHKFEKYVISKSYAIGLTELTERKNIDCIAAKGQITGPISFGLSLIDKTGKYVIYNDLYRDIYIKILAMKARAIEQLLEKVSDNTILFVDEPLLYTFGSAYFNMERNIIVRALKDVFGLCNGLKGIHACQNCDWSLIFDSKPDIVSFDAYSFLDKFLIFKDMIKTFVDDGGIIAWGIVPTTDELYKRESATSLADILKRTFDELSGYGIDIGKLANQSIITPADGVGTLSESDAKLVFELSSQVSSAMKRVYNC